MGSGINSSAQGKYTGNGGSAPIEIKPASSPSQSKSFLPTAQLKRAAFKVAKCSSRMWQVP